MKRFKNIFTILIITILTLTLDFYKVNAEDTGYYIKDMDVQVNVNDKREYKITETIKVNFNEDRHGIIRSIPTYTDLEDYKITNISVEGAPYEVEENGNLEIRIGDADETVIGEKTYTVQYIIETYNDEQPEGDYIYLNVLGTEWDTYIEHFTSTITYPQGANLEDITITDGQYGSTFSKYVDYTTKGNTINIESKYEIPEYCGVTVDAMLNEGAFKNAPIRQYPYTIKSDIINAEITKEKEYLIDREFTIEVNKDYKDDFSNNINLWDVENADKDYIKDIKVDNPNISIDAWDNSVSFPKEAGTYKFKVSYKIIPTMKSRINFDISDDLREGKAENIQVNIKSPFAINNYEVEFIEKGVNLGTERYKAEKSENSISFSTLNNVNTGEEINLSLDIDNSLFSRPLPVVSKIITFGSPILLIVLVLMYIKNKDNNPVISAVEFYPPKDMNSADVAYAFKEHVRTKDVTTLLFYWASQNHIKITMKKDGGFTLTKICELDEKHKSYEKELFRKIFNCGDGETVTNSMLEGKIASDVIKASCAVSDEFKGNKELRDSLATMLGFGLTLLSTIPVILCGVLSGQINHNVFGESLLIGLLAIFILCSLYFMLHIFNKGRYTEKGKSKATKVLIFSAIIYTLVCIIGFSMLNIPMYISLIVAVVSFLGMAMSSFIPRRTDYGREILEHIIGFRNFVEVAEKDRLEALLEEDPEYFYNTLPYAHVLGVTKKWADKFQGITMQSPTFYETYYPMNNVYMMTHLMDDLNKVNETMTHTNDSSNGGSGGSFGGGGGFSGGGFSGGGAGGGGGSSW
ncbi:MAG: DUF2207 domain-containing protein [Peptostreptococcaceae bacterium]|nr:DUF2207 domain-containing protein [Peptostreptococcaceae bacterium]